MTRRGPPQTRQEILLDACRQIERVHTRTRQDIQLAFEEAQQHAEAHAKAQAAMDETFLRQLRHDVERQTSIWKTATARVQSGYFD